MKISHFIGIDVSKDTLDISLVTDGEVKCYMQINNAVKNIQKVVPGLLKDNGANMENAVFCMEHTGMYGMILVKWLSNRGANIWLETAQQITLSSGIVRGKNDKIDSKRIALYAFKNHGQMRLWRAPKPILERIAALLAQRTRLIKAKKQLSVALSEQRKFIDKEVVKTIEKYAKGPIKAIQSEIDAIEKVLLSIIKEDSNISRLFKIITSVDGIGMLTAANILVTTNEFNTINDPKKYACFSGVVPFDHSSGTSIRRKTRVSHRANKTIKTLLHLSALSAVKQEGDIKNYYLRKIQEGKNKMSILNAVRNKLILRVFACVKQDRVFEKDYVYKAA